jgi:hypothetical protein
MNKKWSKSIEVSEGLDKETVAFVNILCGFLNEALEGALEEVEDSFEDIDPMEVAGKHIKKRLSYMQDEGWISSWSDKS